MTQDEYLKFHEEMCNAARALSVRKNNDYADPNAHTDDTFAVFRNFTACERAGVTSTEVGFMVRILDKVMRISNLMRPGHDRKVNDESITDTLRDLVNYAILLAAYLETKGKGSG